MELTMNRLSYLFYLNRMEEKDCTVTKMAKVFSVSKSTVSRNLDYFVAQGVVFSDSMRLTMYGKELAERYDEEVELLKLWVVQTVNIDDQEVLENAMADGDPSEPVHEAADVPEDPAESDLPEVDEPRADDIFGVFRVSGGRFLSHVVCDL